MVKNMVLFIGRISNIGGKDRFINESYIEGNMNVFNYIMNKGEFSTFAKREDMNPATYVDSFGISAYQLANTYEV